MLKKCSIMLCRYAPARAYYMYAFIRPHKPLIHGFSGCTSQKYCAGGQLLLLFDVIIQSTSICREYRQFLSSDKVNGLLLYTVLHKFVYSSNKLQVHYAQKYFYYTSIMLYASTQPHSQASLQLFNVTHDKRGEPGASPRMMWTQLIKFHWDWPAPHLHIHTFECLKVDCNQL